MAEDEKSADQSEETKDTQDIDGKIQSAMAEIEKRFKSEISGLNRKNTELKEELESERKAKMTETERLKFEKESAEKKAAELEARQQEYQTDQMITAGLAAKDINVTVKSLMKKPTTGEELLEWMSVFNKSVETEVERRVNERLQGKTPVSSHVEKQTKNLESFKDGKEASEEDFLAYLKKTIGD